MTHSHKKKSRSSPRKPKTPTAVVKNVTTVSQKTKGAPRYCKTCPGHPLRASIECQHSAIWRKANASSRTQEISNGNNTDQQSATTPGDILGLLPQAPPYLQYESNGILGLSRPKTTLPTGARSESEHEPLPGSGRNPDKELPFPLDPALQITDIMSAVHRSHGPLSSPVVSTYAASPSIHSSGRGPLSSPGSGLVAANRLRVRVSKDNATYGWVEGAGRGQFPLGEALCNLTVI
ncbi:uncharacterized protein C8R40DRAFT_1068038 [Lentinula edodes]|uniref:uncharacterized protein n=1 Tax=Lentinula edodes TaxID=5353 RepID=UPI001E8E6151|nr:uncharacterized protein C8R40DRAFT_1068038 [Lentinula edodes]KAH7877327.1 hypothetical protein C8R40DRAFT_1068038 [Lentinula edodes]